MRAAEEDENYRVEDGDYRPHKKPRKYESCDEVSTNMCTGSFTIVPCSTIAPSFSSGR